MLSLLSFFSFLPSPWRASPAAGPPSAHLGAARSPPPYHPHHTLVVVPPPRNTISITGMLLKRKTHQQDARRLGRRASPEVRYTHIPHPVMYHTSTTTYPGLQVQPACASQTTGDEKYKYKYSTADWTQGQCTVGFLVALDEQRTKGPLTCNLRFGLPGLKRPSLCHPQQNQGRR